MGLSFCMAVSTVASPSPTREGTPCSCHHVFTGSPLFLRGEDSGLILPLRPPLGRVSLPEEVAQAGVEV